MIKVKRSRRGWCDHSVGTLLDSPVHRAEPATVRQADCHTAARGHRPGSQGPAVEPVAGGPGPAGRLVLAGQPHPAPTRSAVRGVEVLGRPHHRPPRTLARPAEAQAVPQDTVLIVDGTLVPTRDQQVAEQSKNYRVGSRWSAGEHGRGDAAKPWLPATTAYWRPLRRSWPVGMRCREPRPEGGTDSGPGGDAAARGGMAPVPPSGPRAAIRRRWAPIQRRCARIQRCSARPLPLLLRAAVLSGDSFTKILPPVRATDGVAALLRY